MQESTARKAEQERPPRVVIVGAGFGGLTAAQALAKAPVEVTVIDRRNYHLFQPLLYQVATAGLSPAEIAWPIRGILRYQRNAAVQLSRVTGVDTTRREVLIGERRVGYDYLILATGARHAYFNHPEWERAAPGLKKMADATQIRERMLMAFEQAEADACTPEERDRLLTFVIVGGGPTGVEMAGAIAELAKRALAADFRAIDPGTTRIVLIEAGPRLLPAFPEALSEKARRALERLGVEVRLGAPVTWCDEAGVRLGGEAIGARTIIWAAGVMASPAATWLGAERDRAGRVKVARDFSVPGHPEIFVIGDTAALTDAAGRVLPGLAPAAKQAGAYVASVIRARLAGKAPPAAFRYRDYGNLATIGRKAAVVDFGRVRLSGFVAWLLWSVAHIYFLIGLRNRMVVALTWLWSYITFQRGARLIIGGESDAVSPEAEAAGHSGALRSQDSARGS
jgi:NADH dehydrogenase